MSDVKYTPFDFIRSINETKKNLMVDEKTESFYNAFIVNRGLSYFVDTVLHANEVNRRPWMPARDQYVFLKGVVRPSKRFAKWHKREEEVDVQLIAEFFNCSIKKGREYMTILGNEKVAEIINIMKNKAKTE